MNYKPADDKQIDTFVKTAVDRLTAKGVDEVDAVCQLSAGLAKHAERLGIMERAEGESRRRIEAFKKKASAVLTKIK